MSNHFHVLVRVPVVEELSDGELLRRYQVLYPKPTEYQTASIGVLKGILAAGGAEAEDLRRKLQARMGDVSEFMKILKQRFSVWYYRSHQRYGTLWAERFKSVLVEGQGNPLQTMAAYIDLNPVRTGLVEDPKDYRFCGYAEAVAGKKQAREGIRAVWADRVSREALSAKAPYREESYLEAMQSHRELIFGKRAAESGLSEMSREKALKVLEEEKALLPRATVLRCRVRYFTDGAILGSRSMCRALSEPGRARSRGSTPPSPI